MTELSERVQWDVTAEVEAKYAHTYDHRAGEVIVAFVLASGLHAWGRTYSAGTVIAIAVGEPRFWHTVDVDDGCTWLDLDPDEQAVAWGHVGFVCPPPLEVLQSESVQYEIATAKDRAQRWAQAREHAATLEAG